MNKREILSSIISRMRADQNKAKAERDANYFGALKNTDFAAADRAVRELTVQLSKTDSQKIKLDLDAAIARRDKILKTLIPKNAAAPLPVCPKCGGSGYYKGKPCPCVYKQYTNLLIEQSGFKSTAPKSFAAEDLTKIFKDDTTRREYKSLYAKLQQYCEKFPEVKTKNIVLCGAAGTGKTHAAQILANAIMERGFSVLYLTAFSLIQRFKSYITNFDASETDALFDCDLLVIDDLGTEPTIKNITHEYLYNVINERISHDRPFLITTNLSPDDLLARYDQRLYSRIMGRSSAVLRLRSADLRQR
jgi:DNA replication protein DnaC